MSEGNVWKEIGMLNGQMEGVGKSIATIEQTQNEVWAKLDQIHDDVTAPHECIQEERLDAIDETIAPLVAAQEDRNKNKKDWRRFFVDVAVLATVAAAGWLLSLMWP